MRYLEATFRTAALASRYVARAGANAPMTVCSLCRRPLSLCGQGGRSEEPFVLRGHGLAASVPAEVPASPDPPEGGGERRRCLRHRLLRRGGHQGDQGRSERRPLHALVFLPGTCLSTVIGFSTCSSSARLWPRLRPSVAQGRKLAPEGEHLYSILSPSPGVVQ